MGNDPDVARLSHWVLRHDHANGNVLWSRDLPLRDRPVAGIGRWRGVGLPSVREVPRVLAEGLKSKAVRKTGAKRATVYRAN